MGMNLFASAARSAERAREASRSRLKFGVLLPGDPDPARYEIKTLEPFGAFCVATIRWPDATNFDGTKVAVYRATPVQLQAATHLDPHFQEQRGPLVPIARFEPTAKGIELARAVAATLAEAEREELRHE